MGDVLERLYHLQLSLGDLCQQVQSGLSILADFGRAN